MLTNDLCHHLDAASLAAAPAPLPRSARAEDPNRLAAVAAPAVAVGDEGAQQLGRRILPNELSFSPSHDLRFFAPPPQPPSGTGNTAPLGLVDSLLRSAAVAAAVAQQRQEQAVATNSARYLLARRLAASSPQQLRRSAVSAAVPPPSPQRGRAQFVARETTLPRVAPPPPPPPVFASAPVPADARFAPPPPSPISEERAAVLAAAEACLALSHDRRASPPFDQASAPPAIVTSSPSEDAAPQAQRNEGADAAAVGSVGAKTNAKKRKKSLPAVNGGGSDDDAAKQPKKKGRKKENGMPRRPLSAYNIFFSEERERILAELPEKDAEPHLDSEEDTHNGEGEKPPPQPSTVTPAVEPAAADPAHCVVLERRIFPSVAPKVRRRHRRTHGKISFRDLAKTIGQRWKELPADKMERYKRLAKVDMDRYQDDMAKYRKSGGGNAAASASTAAGLSVEMAH